MERRRWTKEEIEYLSERWGDVSIKGLAKKFNRSINSVSLKANRIGLGNFNLSGDYLTLFQLGQALNMHNNLYMVYTKWVGAGLPIKHKTVVSRKIKVIYIEDFWEWAEQHQEMVNFSRMEKNILGIEPEWVDVKRKTDGLTKNLKRIWTTTEIHVLEQMLLGKYTYAEIAKSLKRTECSITSKVHDLKKNIKKDIKMVWDEEEEE